MKRTHILVVLDGWGQGEENETNPIFVVKPKIIEEIESNFSTLNLQASGIAVGLPWNEEGNSEVGHLTLGAGRTIYQHYPKITLAIENGSFFNNPVLKSGFEHARKFNSKVHIIGLLTSGSVHASLRHLQGLIEMAKKENYNKTYLHLFSDGRDSPPKSFLNLIDKVIETMKKFDNFCILKTVIGRYYAMNREENWDRTQKAYQALLGEAEVVDNLFEKIKSHYERGLDDEFVYPFILNKVDNIEENDVLIFFNFREDSMRQIVEPFVNSNFNHFPIKKFNNLYIVTFTQYRKDYNCFVAFPNEIIRNTLGEVLANYNKIQLRIAETEKYAHVTYFFNGLIENPFLNEFRVLIPSLNISRIDERPEMMATAITDRVLAALNENNFDFILINYANPDIIAHTGNYEAALKAVKVIEDQLTILIKAVLANNHLMIITSDHGNIEQMFDPISGQPETKHNNNPVPFYLIAKEYQKLRTNNKNKKAVGVLSDVAPTILELMQLPQPKEMTGISLMTEIS